MAELVESLGQLKATPDGVHLLCPRQSDEDMTLYDSDYVDQCHQRDTKPDPAIANAIETAKHRREQFLTCTQLLAFNSDEGEVAESQAWIWAKLQGALERCDLCIKEYYKGKLWLMGQLRQTYDEAEVEKFGKILDSWDISRICANLDQAKDMLLAAPTDKRTLAALDRPRLLSIFEALSCSAFLDDNEAMSKHFDQPFQLVQTRRLLKILDYVPASTKLLFDADEFRRRWAASSWAKYKRPPSTVEFEWAIKDPLMRILQVGSVPPVPEDVVLRLWQGISLIVRRLDSQQITHQLRALPIDPIRLSVDHIGVTTPAFRPLINTIHTVIEKTPGDFWEAAQTASPQAFIEAVFYNPQFAVFLTEASDTSNSEAQGTFQDMLSWISPFMASLKSDHRPQACRTLISQLLNRIQRKDFGDNVKYHSFIAGLAVLIGTLRTFTDNEASRGSVAQVVLSDILQVISENIERFLKPPTFTGEQDDKKLKTMCMDVVRNTLALECQSLKADYEAILRSSDLQHGVSTYSPHIWDAVVRGLQDQDTDLSSATLLGILPLVGLEKFITKSAESEQKTHFNVIYGHLTHLACQVLERLADFSTAHVLELLRRSDTNCSLVSALFSADLNTYQAAIDLIKAVSGQPGRREAIAHLISLSPTITIRGFGWSFRRISAMKTFSSAPRMVKTGTDIVNVLCDPEIPGILRKKISDVEEARALKGLWQHQWQSLATVFECTEQWHQMGNDRSVMLEFCRDTIQFAALLFDQFSVFVSALADFDAEEPMPANTALLHPLTATMRWMVRWLRLKDEYLAHTLVELVLKVLHYLAELKVTISQDALGFIEAVALTSTVRTILTDQEKAELIRALETYYGKPLVSAPEVKPVVDKAKVSAAGKVGRQSRIDSFARPADTVSVSSSTSDETVSHIKKGDESSEVPDDVSLDLTGLNELRKRAGAKRAATSIARPGLLPMSKPASPLIAQKSAQSIQSFREKREKEREEKKRRDALELARLKSKALAARAAMNEDLAHAGSGLASLRVPVVDHSLRKDSMMVSSESESEDDDDDDAIDLLGGRKSTVKPDAVRAYEESRKIRIRAPVRKTRVARSAKDMRARLMPDLSPLHRVMLSWDPFAMKGSDFPPNAGRTDFSLVSNVFPTAADYQRTFEPLLMLEAWQSFQSVVEEGGFKPFPVNILTRLNVDNFVEVVSSMTPQDQKSIGIGEADLVVLSTNSSPTDANAPRCLARVGRCKREKGKVEVVYRVTNSSSMLQQLNPQTKVFAARITSLTPMEREYCALMALQHYDLSDEIIRAVPSPILPYSSETIQPLQSTYKLNAAQAKAVKSALDNDAFTLIQGPPGSGKTKTICALVGALLSPSLGSVSDGVRIPGSNFRPATRTATAKKLLICAPSNAAVDELVMRLKTDGRTLDGRDHKLNVVRIGRSDAINANVLDVTLDELIAQRMAASTRKTTEDPFALVEKHKETNQRFTQVRAQIDQFRAKGELPPKELQHEFDILKQERTQLSMDIDNAREKKEKAARDEKVDRRRFQQEVIDSAHVICATLSGSGHEMFQTLSVEFETVIIDEAAQSIELSALIPLKYGCNKCILVGDPKQLPPTVLSKEAARFQYEQSLFVRMQANHPNDVHLLDTQYRMHPEISAFPSSAFYDGRLKNGPDMAGLRRCIWHNSTLLSPYRFFDVRGMHANTAKGHSLVNVAEVRVALKLYDRLLTDYGARYNFDQKIGIITPYKGQLREMKNQFAGRYGNAIFEKVEFNTTDAFQGRECEVIIFSCVRASNRGIGFLADIRRMNVGLTRAKSSLWVLGNSQSLVQGQFWKALIENAQSRKLYTNGDVSRMLEKPQAALDDQYNDVEMADAESTSAQQASSATPSVVTVESDTSSPTVGVSASSKRAGSNKPTPSGSPRLAPRVDGPSGGGNGLNDLQMCGHCGSYEHMTHSCDNVDAKAVSQGQCSRCKALGHSVRNCQAIRCLRCGVFGHGTSACKSEKEMSRREKERVRREEVRHDQAQAMQAERRKQRQLGDHDRKVPAILVGSDASSSTSSGGTSKKRKNEGQHPAQHGSGASSYPKRPRPALVPPEVRRGRKLEPESLAPPPSNLITPSEERAKQSVNKLTDASALAAVSRDPATSANQTPGANPPVRPNAGLQARPPVIRRKRPADPFIRPKKR